MLKTIRVDSAMQEGFAVKTELAGHEIYIDQPVTAKGTGKGPTPLEMMLFAVGGCICTIARIAAFQQKINLRGIKVSVSANYDPDALMGKPTEARAGFQQINIEADIDADLDLATKQRFLDEVCQRCPLHDNLLYGTVVEHRLG